MRGPSARSFDKDDVVCQLLGAGPQLYTVPFAQLPFLVSAVAYAKVMGLWHATYVQLHMPT